MQTDHPEGNLRAEQIVLRGEGQAVPLEQPEQYGIERGNPRKAWTRSEDGSSPAEIDAEDAQLRTWAKTTGHYVRLSAIVGLSKLADRAAKGNEHDVFIFSKRENPFVIRLTKRDMFGMPHRTPGEYIDRWRLSNAAFPDTEVSLLGYTENGRGNGVILTSQRYFEGSKRTQKAIDAAFGKLGYLPMSKFFPSYGNPTTGVEIHDAHPDNVIFDKAGNPIPFDVLLNDPQNYFGIQDCAFVWE